jgi:hypothetical protein
VCGGRRRGHARSALPCANRRRVQTRQCTSVHARCGPRRTRKHERRARAGAALAAPERTGFGGIWSEAQRASRSAREHRTGPRD